MHTITLFLKQKDLRLYLFDGDLEIFLVAILKILKVAVIFFA